MSIKILCDQTDEVACLYDSVYEKAFGTLFHDDGNLTAQEVAEDFLSWANYNGVESSIGPDTMNDLLVEYETAKSRNEWPLPEEE